MENQDLDLIGQTVGNMPYKIGIVDENGNLKNQFVAKASTNRIDIPEQFLSGGSSAGGSTGGNTGGTAGGNTGDDTGDDTGGHSSVPQLSTSKNLFSGSAFGNILLSGPTPNYDNVQDGLLITLSNITSTTAGGSNFGDRDLRFDLSSVGLKGIKIPKEKLVVNNSFDISDQLSQYIKKTVQGQLKNEGSGHWPLKSSTSSWESVDNFYSDYSSFSIKSFGGATIKVLSNTTLSMNLTVHINGDYIDGDFQIPVIQVNTYKN